MGANRGELREEREEELPIPSLLVERFSCANMSRQLEESRLPSCGCMSSKREELLPPKMLALC